MFFSTKIKLPRGSSHVTVRKNMGVFPNDYISQLPNGEKISGEVFFSENWIWMKLGNERWIALRDGKGKVFAEDLPDDPNAPKPPKRFAFVQHCFQSKKADYKNYMDWRGFRGMGDPSCYQWINTKTTKSIQLNRYMQELIHGFNVTSAQGTMTEAELKNDWKNLTAWNKAFTNKGNNRNYDDPKFADYILGIGENLRQGITTCPVVPTGATIELVGNPYRKYGVMCQDFKVLDMLDKDSYQITWKTHWQYVVAATNSVRAEYDNQGILKPNAQGKKEIIDPFPKMEGNRTTFWLLMGLGTTVQTTYADGLLYLDYEPTRPLYPYYPYRNRNIGSYENDFWDTRFVL